MRAQSRASAAAPVPTSVLVLVEQRYRTQEQPASLIDALLSAGHRVDVVDDRAESLAELARRQGELKDSFDVAVLRGRSPHLLDAARAVAAQGVPLVDPPHAVEAVRDKQEMDRRFFHHQIATPLTWAGDTEKVRAQVMTAHPAARSVPLICKPVDGDNGRGIHVLASAADLTGLAWDDDRIIVQHYVPGSHMDLKLYVIGSRIFAVRKPSPVVPDRSALPAPSEPLAEAVAVTAVMEDIVQRCRAAFDLTVFGVDCVETDSGLLVIEVNDFPNFSSVSDAGRLLADHVLAHRRASIRLASVPVALPATLVEGGP